MARSLRRNRDTSESASNFVTAEVKELLDVLDIASVLLSPGEVPLYYSPSAVTLGVIRDEKLVGDDLHALIRTVRRSGKSQDGIFLPDLQASCQHLLDTWQLFRGHAKFKNVYDTRTQVSLRDCVL